ncbi:caspase-8 [Notothenia coriiceps]|uniref:Caspase-8 n=1 Tax=Notothenia coriiceps TaxID=8208 RepID=A0A6I9NFA5_9TELE|nr:PREDICTED: caspase-8-like [Notothenia coriiceps]XP_010773157.1 PREDICTED: caspase-8-like [Notothenia coriiceps]XP_010773158.1 PREDICTED: caspase-8-like [Notothenia coriiceps]
MDRLTLSHIDEQLESSEVAALCFLCRDVVNIRRLEGIADAKRLFLRLEEQGLLEDYSFLCQLLQTIRRADLLNRLETDSRRPEETDASPVLSEYRVALYKIYADMTEEHLETLKFLLSDKLGRRQTEACKTALDVFAEMEKTGFLSNTNLRDLHEILQRIDQQLAAIIQRYVEGITQPLPRRLSSHLSMDNQGVQPTTQPTQPVDVSTSETQPSYGEASVCTDAEPKTSSSLSDQTDYYALTHVPRGLCVVINNEDFTGMSKRNGTQADVEALRTVFTALGFTVLVRDNLTAGDMKLELHKLCMRNFLDEDALVICVLSHGEKECVFGTDGKPVFLRELSQPFSSRAAPTLAGKPKLLFIQACQGSGYQRGSMPCPPKVKQEEEEERESHLEEDAGPLRGETVPWGADFLLGMATVPECKSFRNTTTGSIYIQELCKQLKKSASSSKDNDDILTVLTRVNREVSKGEYLTYKQMPEPKYTLTKKLVLKCV